MPAYAYRAREAWTDEEVRALYVLKVERRLHCREIARRLGRGYASVRRRCSVEGFTDPYRSRT